MEQIRASILLEPGEFIRSFYKTQPNPLSGASGGGESGYLVLTNYRILFYAEKGIIRKSYNLKISAYLANLIDVSSGGRLVKSLSIDGIKYFLQGSDPRKVCELIRSAAQEAKMYDYSPGLSSPPQQHIQHKINDDIPAQSVEEDFYPIYCTHCGSENDVDAKFCKNCGAKLENNN
ncbi:MAG: zinc ribbon domain-containing protein [Promethearchaeota archaeon]